MLGCSNSTASGRAATADYTDPQHDRWHSAGSVDHRQHRQADRCREAAAGTGASHCSTACLGRTGDREEPARTGQARPGWKTYTDPGGAEAGLPGQRHLDPATRSRTRRRTRRCRSAARTQRRRAPCRSHCTRCKAPTGPAPACLPTGCSCASPTKRRRRQYFTGYQARMKGCGDSGGLAVQPLWSAGTSAAPSTPVRRRRRPMWRFLSSAGATVALLAEQSAKPSARRLGAQRRPRNCEAVIDSGNVMNPG